MFWLCNRIKCINRHIAIWILDVTYLTQVCECDVEELCPKGRLYVLMLTQSQLLKTEPTLCSPHCLVCSSKAGIRKVMKDGYKMHIGSKPLFSSYGFLLGFVFFTSSREMKAIHTL